MVNHMCSTDVSYVYGSHDRFGGNNFCMNDYVTWSAPVDDLSDWRYEGVIWRKKTTQQPMARECFMLQMFAKVQMVNFIYTIAQFKVSPADHLLSTVPLLITLPVHLNIMAMSI